MTAQMRAQPVRISSAASFRAIALWLLVQIAALMLPVHQIALSDKFPRPIESMAIEEMLAAQIAAAAVLFPIVCSTWTSTVIAIACTWPFIQIAGTFSAAEPMRLVLAGAYVAAWLTLLSLWRAILPSERMRLMAAGIACLASLGLGAVWYLRTEFLTENLDVNWGRQGLMGPIMGALAIVSERRMSVWPWMPMMIAMGITLSAGIIVVLRKRRLGNPPAENPTEGKG